VLDKQRFRKSDGTGTRANCRVERRHPVMIAGTLRVKILEMRNEAPFYTWIRRGGTRQSGLCKILDSHLMMMSRRKKWG